MKTPQSLNITMVIAAISLILVSYAMPKATGIYLIFAAIIMVFIFLPLAIVNSPEKTQVELIYNAVNNTGYGKAGLKRFLFELFLAIPLVLILLSGLDLIIRLVVGSVLLFILVFSGKDKEPSFEEKRRIAELATSKSVMDRVRKNQPINFAIICITIALFGIIYFTQIESNIYVLVCSFVLPLIILSFYKAYVKSI